MPARRTVTRSPRGKAETDRRRNDELVPVPVPTHVAHVQALQRTIGNRAVARLFSGPETVQRVTNAKQAKKLKSQRRNAKRKQHLAEAGGVGLKGLQETLALPLTALDQLTALPLHAKDAYQFAKHGGKTREQRAERIDQAFLQGKLKRRGGLTGLAPYAAGMNYHAALKEVADEDELTIPWMPFVSPVGALAKGQTALGGVAAKQKGKAAAIDARLNPAVFGGGGGGGRQGRDLGREDGGTPARGGGGATAMSDAQVLAALMAENPELQEEESEAEGL